MAKQSPSYRSSYRRQRFASRRRGYTLVFFAMMLFGIMAMAALVIDVGFARLTQRQMQTAVDAAALEGLRFRDEIPISLINTYGTELEAACGTINAGDPSWRDCARRWFASNQVSSMFDDDLNATPGDLRSFGAGPIVNLIDPVTGPVGDPDINASQLLSIPATPVFKPSLELNAANNVSQGDMVAGSFEPNPSFDPPNGDTNPAINEYSDPNTGDYYVRRNFLPSAPTAADSFLVRMRRLHDDFDAVDTEAGISSKGPEIPFLFGRGAMLPIENPDGDYLPRIHGIAVRATAIVDAQPALSAGVALPAHNLPGSTAFCVFLGSAADGWLDLPAGTSVTLEIGSTGAVSWVTAMGNTQIGYVLVANGESQLVSVAQQFAHVEPSPNVDDYVTSVITNAATIGASRQIFIPIVGDNGGATENQIVGFGFALVDSGTNPNELVITKQQRHIAHENASVVPMRDVNGTPADDIFSDNSVLRDAGDSLLAPASVR